MPRISPAERPLVDLIVPFDMLKDLCHSHDTPSTRLSREGSPFPIDVMLSDEAGRLPEQLFLEVVQCLELAACLYSPRCREGVFSETLIAPVLTAQVRTVVPLPNSPLILRGRPFSPVGPTVADTVADRCGA